MRLTGRPRPREGANSERGSQPGSCWHTRVSSPDPDAGSVRKAITGFDLQETDRQKGPQVGQLLLQPPEGESDPFLATGGSSGAGLYLYCGSRLGSRGQKMRLLDGRMPPGTQIQSLL